MKRFIIVPSILTAACLPVATLSLVTLHTTVSTRILPIRNNLSCTRRGVQLSMSNDAESSSSDDNAQQQKQLSRIEAVRKMLPQDGVVAGESSTANQQSRRDSMINAIAAGLLVACGVASFQLFQTNIHTPTGFQRFASTQFIAALGDLRASEGRITSPWGWWPQDPGPRGVRLRDFDRLLQ